MASTVTQERIAILGAGITGLSAAYAFKKAGIPCMLFEKATRAGGVVHTVSQNGFVLETGPNTMMSGEAHIEALLQALGIFQERVLIPKMERFTVFKDQLVAFPMTPKAFFQTPLLPWSAKLRLLLEPILKGKVPLEPETVAQYFTRHFGQAFTETFIDPFVCGIYAAKPETLSFKHTFPKLEGLLKKNSSLIYTLIKRLFKTKEKSKPSMYGFLGGMETLIQAFTAYLGDSLYCNSVFKSIGYRGPRRWEIVLEKGAESRTECFTRIISTIPPYAYKDVPFCDTLQTALHFLGKLPYAPIAVLGLGYDKTAIEHPMDGFGFLTPSREKNPLLGAFFTSTLFPNRAPEGKALITAFMGGARNPELLSKTDPQLIALANRSVSQLLKIKQAPVFTHCIRWEKAIPQYGLDYDSYLYQMQQAEAFFPGLQLLGSYRRSISVPECIMSGLNAVK